ncbi:MAG: pilus assembly protein [Kordiimonadaceae bacterium]|jgi:Flp pilus assembly protein TadG|nr:pilus assembly protein [Kordiimonadaceae bacterium]MBT6032794.1 pilus assembly protein [Kordiimonadaceae bacterium]
MIDFRKNKFKDIKKKEDGVAFVEFALIAPVLFSLLLGCIDLTMFIIAHQRMSRASYTMSNLITQMDSGLTESQVNDMMLALNQVSRPYDIEQDGIATMTAVIGVGEDGSAPDSYRVAWQRCYGNNSSSSDFGVQGSNVAAADIPDNTITTTGQILVVTELEYTYEPILGFLDLDTNIEYTSFFRPRRGTIEQIVADGATAKVCP